MLNCVYLFMYCYLFLYVAASDILYLSVLLFVLVKMYFQYELSGPPSIWSKDYHVFAPGQLVITVIRWWAFISVMLNVHFVPELILAPVAGLFLCGLLSSQYGYISYYRQL